MQNPVLKAIADRRSIREYTGQQIRSEQLDALLAAAVQSPSARNAQPWHFSVVQNQSLLEDINAAVCEHLNDEDEIFYQAPTVIFISADPEGSYSRMDSGIAVQNIAIAAQALGLGSVILGMPEHAFQTDKADAFRRALKFPAGYDFMIAIAIGYPAASKEAHPVEPGHIDIIT